MQINIELGGARRTPAGASPATPLTTAQTRTRALLKQRTHTLHIEVEKAVDLVARTRDVRSYGALLESFYGFYRPLEDKLARIEGYEGAGLMFEARRKLPLLSNDLIALGSTATALDSFPTCDDLPAVSDLSEALGCLYVLEGSTLGGKVITRLLANRLRLTPSTGAGFFSSYGDRVDSMWAEFCDAIEAHAQSSAHQDSMVSAAQATFRKMGGWIASART